MKVIFLDVDGVLITGQIDWKTPNPECIANLNLLIERTGAQIVVSSCWRSGRTLLELRDLFHQWGVRGPVIGRTDEFMEWRGLEIAQWLKERARERGDVGSFVIIDDDADMGDLLPKLVQTKFHTGLTAEDVQKAIDILNVPC